jgi:hypothetical protein
MQKRITSLEQILNAEILCEIVALWPHVAGRCSLDTVHLFGEENSSPKVLVESGELSTFPQLQSPELLGDESRALFTALLLS